MSKSEHFAPKLKELRELAGLTQQELADRSGLRKAGIANLEQGRTSPAWETVVALCDALGVKCDEFMKPAAADTVAGARGRPTKDKAGEEPIEGPTTAKAKMKGK